MLNAYTLDQENIARKNLQSSAEFKWQSLRLAQRMSEVAYLTFVHVLRSGNKA